MNVNVLCSMSQSDNLIYYSYVAWKDVESLKDHLKGEVSLSWMSWILDVMDRCMALN